MSGQCKRCGWDGCCCDGSSKYELGNLMVEIPDTSALELLGYRIDKMRKEIDTLLDENEDLKLKLKQYENNTKTDTAP